MAQRCSAKLQMEQKIMGAGMLLAQHVDTHVECARKLFAT